MAAAAATAGHVFGQLLGQAGVVLDQLNAAAGQQHYAAFGQGEGRALDTFDETQYLANYTDLQAAFGLGFPTC